jgi:hypothetical protein
MFNLVLTLAIASTPAPTPPSPAMSATGQPAPTVEAVESLRQVAAICRALTPFERLPWKGDVVARAKAEAEHEARRDVILEGRYKMRIPADRLLFAPYDPEEQELALSERAFLAGAGNTLWIWTLSQEGLPVTADAATAERIVLAAQRKTLSLVLTFTMPDDDDEDVTCGHANGTNRYALGIEPYSWEYVDGDKVLAHGGEGGDRPLVTVNEGAKPRVFVSEPAGESGSALKSAVEARRGDLKACYEKALRQNPGLDGAYVAEVEIERGVQNHVRMAADSVQDDSMSACVAAVLARVDFPRQNRVRTAIPIHFELEAPQGPGEASGSGSGRSP